MALGQNIKHLMDRQGSSYPDVATHCGTDPQAIQALVKRDSKKSEYAIGIAEYFGVPVNLLLSGNASQLDMYLDMAKLHQPAQRLYEDSTPRTSGVHVSENFPPSYVSRVPVTGILKTGSGENMSVENEVSGKSINWPSKDGFAYGFRIAGSGVSPRYRHGEYLVIEPTKPVIPGDEVLVLLKQSDSVIVAQFLYEKDGMHFFEDVNGRSIKNCFESESIDSIHLIAGCAKSIMVFDGK